MWRLPDQSRAIVADMIASHHHGLAWCWVAMKAVAASDWKVVSLVVRPIYQDVPEVHLVGARVAIVCENVLQAEASQRWLDGVAGRLQVDSPPIEFSLLGDHVDGFWITSGELWGHGRPASWPEYQVSWSIDGASNVASSAELWEPVEDVRQHFASAWEPIYGYVLGLPYKPGTNAFLNPGALIRLPYPVAIGEAKSSDSELAVLVNEDAPGRAAGHSLHLNYRTKPEQAVPTTINTDVTRPGLFSVRMLAEPVQWSLTLLSSGGVRRDFKEWVVPRAAEPPPIRRGGLDTVLGRDRWRGGQSTIEEAEPPAISTPTAPGQTPFDSTDRQTPSAEVAPDFSRIADADSAELLARRWEEAVICLQAKASLSAITMMGSLLEGALLQVAMRHPAESYRVSAAPKDGATVRPWNRWRLNDLINVAAQAKWITVDIQDFSGMLRNYRNLIHPWESNTKGFHPTEDSAAICWEVTRRAIDQLIAHEASDTRAGTKVSPARKLSTPPRRSPMTPGSKKIADYIRDQRR
jgi:hypothetical protein